MKEPNTKIAVTLFNLRDYCKDQKSLDETLYKVKEIGYKAVQVSGIGSIEPTIVKSLLDKYGLYCCATHESLESYENNFEKIVKKMKILECDFTALGHPGTQNITKEGIKGLSNRLEFIGKKFKKEGITFGYHNHEIELLKFTNKSFLEELYDNTSKNVFAELDVHWIQRGGGDPIDWIQKMNGRTSVIHFKDFALSFTNGCIKPEFAEIGEGNLNWPGIIKACQKTNVRWYVVEQDEPRGSKDIFESIKISFNNMKKLGIN